MGPTTPLGRTYGSGTQTYQCDAPCLGYSFRRGEEVGGQPERLPQRTLTVGGQTLDEPLRDGHERSLERHEDEARVIEHVIRLAAR